MMPATRTHAGMSSHPLKSTWHQMLWRCYMEKSKDYHNYGGRGISVDERWHNLANFISDVGEKPSPDHQIDRINNDGNYGPDNFRWATKADNYLNSRVVVRIPFKGELRYMKDIAKEIGIHYTTLRGRLKDGDGDPFRPRKRAPNKPKLPPNPITP